MNRNIYDFIDSAYAAGFPYVLEIQTKIDGRLDLTEVRSYKDCVYAWRDASKCLGDVYRWYNEEEKERVKAFAHIWKCEPGAYINNHKLICTIGSFDGGEYRNVIRHPDPDAVRIR